MTITLTAPGVYVQELPSGSRSISGVSTSLTAFVGPGLRGPVDTPTPVSSWSEFEGRFGGLWVHSTLSQVVRQYFLNGGARALIVRVVNGDSMVLQSTSAVEAVAGFDHLTVEVSGVAGSTFTLTIQAVDGAGVLLSDGGGDYRVVISVDLAATPEATINAAATGHPISLAQVVGDAVTDAPPEGTWESADNGAGTHVVTIGSQATTATASLSVGITLRATAAVEALVGFDHLSFTVANSNAGAGTFDLTISAMSSVPAILNDGATDYTVSLTGLDVSTEYGAAIAAELTTTTTPIALVEVDGMPPDAVPPDGTADSAESAAGSHAVVLASTLLDLEAADPGAWGDRLETQFSTEEADAGNFHLTLTERDSDGNAVAEEVFYNVTTAATGARFLGRLLELRSQLARLSQSADASALGATPDAVPFAGGGDGAEPRIAQDLEGSQGDRTGMYSLLEANLFNILCLPLPSWSSANAGDMALWSAATSFCEQQRAFLLLDPPMEWSSYTTAVGEAQTWSVRSNNAAAYFPRVRVPDPLQESRLGDFPPCGVVAGVMARTDAQRGVWKAPAGIDASLRGVPELTVPLTDPQQGDLNQLGINCLRGFPVYGRVIWGARTLNGADVQASEWKYVPIRRLALFLEESLFRGSRWAVFESNDEPLWSELRLSIGAFMHQLFRQGAFQGSSAQAAYFVKCDSETTTQSDIDKGVVNVLIGFAPLKPAEFVIIKLQQLAGQSGQ